MFYFNSIIVHDLIVILIIWRQRVHLLWLTSSSKKVFTIWPKFVQCAMKFVQCAIKMCNLQNVFKIVFVILYFCLCSKCIWSSNTVSTHNRSGWKVCLWDINHNNTVKPDRIEEFLMLPIEYFSKVRIACLTHLSGSFHPYWTTLIWLTLGGDHANMTRLFRSLGYIYILEVFQGCGPSGRLWALWACLITSFTPFGPAW